MPLNRFSPSPRSGVRADADRVGPRRLLARSTFPESGLNAEIWLGTLSALGTSSTAPPPLADEARAGIGGALWSAGARMGDGELVVQSTSMLGVPRRARGSTPSCLVTKSTRTARSSRRDR